MIIVYPDETYILYAPFYPPYFEKALILTKALKKGIN